MALHVITVQYTCPGIAQCVQRRPGFDSRQGQDFSLLHNVQTDSGAHPASCPRGNGQFSPGVKRPGREALTFI
jgi:hypothetical protein